MRLFYQPKHASRTWVGDSYLKTALFAAVLNAAQQQDSFLAARYPRFYLCRCRQLGFVMIEHTILAAISNMMADG